MARKKKRREAVHLRPEVKEKLRIIAEARREYPAVIVTKMIEREFALLVSPITRTSIAPQSELLRYLKADESDV